MSLVVVRSMIHKRLRKEGVKPASMAIPEEIYKALIEDIRDTVNIDGNPTLKNDDPDPAYLLVDGVDVFPEKGV